MLIWQPSRPSSSRGPAPPAAQPTWPPPPVFFPCQRTKQLRAGRTRADAGHLLLRRGSLPDFLATPRRRPRPPLTSPSLSGPPSPSLLCFPSRDRTEPPPPTRATVATGHPTAHRRPRKLRRSSLYLLNEPRGPGRAATPPSMSSSTSGPPAIFVKFAGSGPSPTSPSVPSSSP